MGQYYQLKKKEQLTMHRQSGGEGRGVCTLSNFETLHDPPGVYIFKFDPVEGGGGYYE